MISVRNESSNWRICEFILIYLFSAKNVKILLFLNKKEGFVKKFIILLWICLILFLILEWMPLWHPDRIEFFADEEEYLVSNY